jgi:hypothetical protein
MQKPSIILLIIVCACQSTTRAQDPTLAQRSQTSAGAPRDQVEDGAEAGPCDAVDWRKETVSDPSGYPSVVVYYPNEWQLRKDAAARVMVTSGDKPFQFIVSALRGPSQTDEEVKALDAQTAVGQQPAISAWQKVREAPNYRVFEVTRRTPGSTITLRYYAGAEGLVVASFETIDALDPATEQQSARAFTCLNPTFR